jgi:hypothetical protein
MLLLAVPLAAASSGCTKSSDSASGSTPGTGTGASASDGSTAPVAAATNAPGTLGSGFEGGLVMHTTTPHGANDMLFITKGGKLRVDVPVPDGRTAHTIFDPATKKLTILMDSQQIAMEMPLPPPPPGDAPKPATITRTGKHETVAGYDCEDWEIVTQGGAGNHVSTCVTQGLAFFDFSAMAGPTGGHSWADELRDDNAFPLRSVEVDPAGKEISRMEVTKVAKRPVDDTAFTVPPGFHVMQVPNAGLTGPPHPHK